MNCRQLFYVSEVVSGLRDQDIRMILNISRFRNAHDGVTGCLLFSGRHFVQVIEGTEGAIERLFHRIKADARHRHIHVLVDRTCDRMYFDWSMGYLYSLDLADQLARFHTADEASTEECIQFLKIIHPDTVMGPL